MQSSAIWGQTVTTCRTALSSVSWSLTSFNPATCTRCQGALQVRLIDPRYIVVSTPVGIHWMSGRILVASRMTYLLGPETALAMRRVADIVIRLRRVLI